MTIVKMLFKGGNHCTYAHYCTKRSILAHRVLDESGDFVCYFKTVFYYLLRQSALVVYIATTEVANEFALLCG